jgi:hypothetical protein
MWIKCITTFREGTDSYIKGELRCIDNDRGNYVVQNAWAMEVAEPDTTDLPEASQTSTTTDLDVQSSRLALGDNYG